LFIVAGEHFTTKSRPRIVIKTGEFWDRIIVWDSRLWIQIAHGIGPKQVVGTHAGIVGMQSVAPEVTLSSLHASG
jgi:hypothetical protein